MTKVALSPLGRRVLPSITDLLFIGLLFTRLQPTLFYDGDTAWHLWAGTWFLNNGLHAIPDPLSFTRAGVPWASPQWLSEILLAVAYWRGAYMGVALATTAAFAAAFAWLYRQIARTTDHPVVAALVTILAAQTSMVQLVARPIAFTLPLFVGVCLLARSGGRRTIVLGPLLTALWANLHPAAFLATGVLAFWAIARRDRQLGLAAILSALALGATPWGYAWLKDLVPSGQNLSFFLRIDEWRTPGFREPKFWGLLAFILVSLLARRGRGTLALPETLWGLGWLGLALVSARMAPYAAIAWAPYLAADLAPGWRFLGGMRDALAPVEREVRPGLWPVFATVAALALAPSLAPAFPDVARGFSPARFPEAALAAADRAHLGPRVFNGYLWGGYVSWTKPGRYQVFIDGRAGFFGDQVLTDYLEVLELRPHWQEVLASRKPDWILVPAHSAIANVAPVTGRWAKVYEDSTATILVPR